MIPTDDRDDTAPATASRVADSVVGADEEEEKEEVMEVLALLLLVGLIRLLLRDMDLDAVVGAAAADDDDIDDCFISLRC